MRARGRGAGGSVGHGSAGLAFDPEVAAFLEEVHASCSGAPRLRRDPLAVVARYANPSDRELAALVCSTLAFGGVDLIIRACEAALAPLGRSPAAALARMGEAEVREAWSGFQYRFCFPKDMAALMLAARRAREEAGSLQGLFLRGDPGGPDLVAGTAAFVRELKRLSAPLRARGRARAPGGGGAGARGDGIRENLLPDPARGSACKRLFLFLRWMVRRDEVDPGGWDRVDRARLVVPLDLHMVRVCRDRLGFISTPYATLKNALAATAAFRLYAPDDPVKYDFALTRPGIDPEPGDERFGCG